MSLNQIKVSIDEQKEQLLNIKGPIYIKGKSGTGKTFYLLHRIYDLIQNQNVDEEAILFLFPTKQNAKYTKLRYHKVFQEDAIAPLFLDIYSFAYKIIQMYCETYNKPLKKVYSSMNKAIRKICLDEFHEHISREQREIILKKISECVNEMVLDETIQSWHLTYGKGIDFFELFKLYQQFKLKKGIMDHDDLLISAYKILYMDPSILETIQQKYQYIHVDDAQEYSSLSHMIIQMIWKEDISLVMCGDVDHYQKMHGKMHDAYATFTKTYENGKTAQFTTNYRSKKTIVDASSVFYYGKNDAYAREETCEIKFKGFSDFVRLYDYACKKIIDDESEIGFLYRNYAFAIPLIERLNTLKIPCGYTGNLEHFLQESFVKDMWNLIELLVDPRDVRAFYDVHELLGLDISKRILLEIDERLQKDENVDVYQALIESSYKISGKKKLASLMERIRFAQQLNSLEMIDFIIEKLEYQNILLENGKDRVDPVVIALKVIAQYYPKPDEFLCRLSMLKDFESDPHARVQVHALTSKLVSCYKRICILDCMKNYIPRSSDIDYEKGLLYQGMIHARDELEFFSAKRMTTTRMELSSFLYDIYAASQGKVTTNKTNDKPKSKVVRINDLKVGVAIHHANFGDGKIEKIEGEMMSVRFGDEIKRMNIKICLRNKWIKLI